MKVQFLPFAYGTKQKLEKKLLTILGGGNFNVLEVEDDNWKVEVRRTLTQPEIADIKKYMKGHYAPDT